MVEMPVAVASSVLSPSIKDVFTTVIPSPLRKSRNCCAASAEASVCKLRRERRERIDHQATRMVRAHLRPQSTELVFDVGSSRARGIHLEQPGLHVGGESNADRSEIANDLSGAFVEAHIQGALAAFAGGGGEQPGQRRLGGSGRAGDEDVAAAVIAATQHVVETRKPGRNPLIGDLVLERGGATIGQLQAILGERDRKLVARKARAAVLHDAKMAEGRSIDHLMPENDHAIDHELQEAVALVGFVPADLLRDDAGQPRLRQPVADAIDFSTLRHRVVEEAEQHVDPVEDDARRMNLFGLGLKEGEHADQVEFPRLHDRLERGAHPGRRASSFRAREDPIRTWRRWPRSGACSPRRRRKCRPPSCDVRH